MKRWAAWERQRRSNEEVRAAAYRTKSQRRKQEQQRQLRQLQQQLNGGGKQQPLNSNHAYDCDFAGDNLGVWSQAGMSGSLPRRESALELFATSQQTGTAQRQPPTIVRRESSAELLLTSQMFASSWAPHSSHE
jgi:hypothetical protein